MRNTCIYQPLLRKTMKKNLLYLLAAGLSEQPSFTPRIPSNWTSRTLERGLDHKPCRRQSIRAILKKLYSENIYQTCSGRPMASTVRNPANVQPRPPVNRQALKFIYASKTPPTSMPQGPYAIPVNEGTCARRDAPICLISCNGYGGTLGCHGRRHCPPEHLLFCSDGTGYLSARQHEQRMPLAKALKLTSLKHPCTCHPVGYKK